MFHITSYIFTEDISNYLQQVTTTLCVNNKYSPTLLPNLLIQYKKFIFNSIYKYNNRKKNNFRYFILS